MHDFFSKYLIDNLIPWYRKYKRSLPWRAELFENTNLYHVFLSEIMLQQTVVKTVIPYFYDFIDTWSTIQHLANAHEDEILAKWAGLGYYSRARNMHKAAKILSLSFPKTHETLIKLPGIGPYTAKAIAAIAFNQNCVPVDGNVIRVLSRFFGVETKPPQLKSDIEVIAVQLNVEGYAFEFAQSLMDLGSGICKPKKPNCTACPIRSKCFSNINEVTDNIPNKAIKKELPLKTTTFYLIEKDGAVLFERRPEKGLFAKMFALPHSEIIELTCESKFSNFQIKHTFTHFKLFANVEKISDACKTPFENAIWIPPKDFEKFAMPTLIKKCLKAAL